MVPSRPLPWIVALTGASGIRYGLRLLRALHDLSVPVELVVSDAAQRVLAEEEGIAGGSKLSIRSLLGSPSPHINLHNLKDIGATIASGSYRTAGMVIIPCSMSTLGMVAHGCGENLIHRAADVILKEGRRLILVPRETPLSPIHLENMLTLSRIPGVSILPAMPGFYHRPKTLEEIIDMLVMKVLDQMGIDNEFVARWGKEKSGR